MTLYAIPTTTGKVRHDGERIRGEWAVEKALEAMGCTVHDQRAVEFKRKGKKRFPELIYSPCLPGYVFAEIPDDIFGRAVHVAGAFGSALPIPKGQNPEYCPTAAVMRFLYRLATKRKEAERCEGNATMAQAFEMGEPLQILAGPFADQLAKFSGVVHRAHDMHPKIKLDMEVMGQRVPIEIDPLDVRKAS